MNEAGATDHRVPLAGDWTLWRTICIRAAGFPAKRLLPLATEGIEEAVLTRQARASDLRSALERGISACDEAQSAGGKDDRSALRSLRKKLRSGRAPEGDRFPTQLAGPIEKVREAVAARDAADRQIEQRIAADEGRIALELRAVAIDPRFREVLAWQNREILETAIAPLLRRHEANVAPLLRSSSSSRQHEQLIASYLQRIAAKNDSIGFFGPIGWGRFAETERCVRLEPGPALVCERALYFEHWAIDALAQRFASNPALRPWLRPRRSPALHVEGDAVFDHFGEPLELSAFEGFLLGAADGTRSARDIAVELTSARAIESVQDVYLALLKLQRRRLLTWTIEIPTEDPHPEAHLAKTIESIGDPALRERFEGTLMALEKLRSGVSSTAGNPTALDRAIGDLEATFERCAGVPSTRRRGETYAGRTLIYEDCRRDLVLELDPSVLAKISAALSLVLKSARWLTFALATSAREQLIKIFRGIRARDRISFAQFWRDAAAAVAPIADAVLARFKSAWSAILGAPADARRVERRASELEESVARSFAAPGPGWPLARYHSIDLQIAGASAEEIAAGRFLAIIGELHAGVNGHLVPMFLRRHPRPEELLAYHELDVPEAGVAPVIGKDRFNRAELYSVIPRDIHVLARESASFPDREHVVEIGELVIEQAADSLRVETRDRRFSRDIIAFLERYLIGTVLNRFSVLPEASHTPRVSIDDLVLVRESWRAPPESLAFAWGKSPSARFLGAVEWASARGLPRFLFYKIPEEPKPCYLDLSSPLFVDMFAHAVRKASNVSISEMLPAHDALWLPDKEDNRYTSELRLIAVDAACWQEPQGSPPPVAGSREGAAGQGARGSERAHP